MWNNSLFIYYLIFLKMTEVIKEQELIVRIRESSRIKIDLLENGESIFGPVL